MAFDRIQKGGIDLVISDIRMPNGTGIDLLRKLRRYKMEGHLPPPVIIFTGLLDKGESYLKALGAREIFLKPTSLSTLATAAERLLNKIEPKLEGIIQGDEPTDGDS